MVSQHLSVCFPLFWYLNCLKKRNLSSSAAFNQDALGKPFSSGEANINLPSGLPCTRTRMLLAELMFRWRVEMPTTSHR
ncbi:hypothetical protein AVEN_10333-1 [Araneus ventricosus]|uniref:Uncharacterized protein n=1 Tax=Araneus ventricosus TaxID=182803 RepID=A0A4Y2UFG5_ARAVE|nr:hypothetical protein AVEN_10333-1 [Araneus ventricosus]